MGFLDIFKKTKKDSEQQKEQQARIIEILQPTRNNYPIFEQALKEMGVKADIDEGRIPSNVQVRTNSDTSSKAYGQIDIIYHLGKKSIWIAFNNLKGGLSYNIEKLDRQQKGGMAFHR